MKKNKLLFSLLVTLFFLLTILIFLLINIDKKKEKTNNETTENLKVINKNIIEKEIYLNHDIKNKTSIYYDKNSFNFDFEKNNEDSIFDFLIDKSTWENLNFNEEDSLSISKTLNANPVKIKNIIFLMKKYDSELKLDLVPIENELNVFYSIHSKHENNISKTATKKSINKNVKQMNISIFYKDKNIVLDYLLLKDGFSEYSLEDDLNQRYLYGNDIQDLIDNKILILNFPHTRDLAIEETLNALQLKSNYNNFKINIKYSDRTNFNYNITK